MTPPTSFSGVPQQPQALQPYGVNQQQQQYQQPLQVPQQFGNVPAGFTGQPSMTPYNYTYQQQPFQPANRVRSGRSQQAVADEIQVLENTPLPAGGNPFLAGALTLGATAAVTTGVSAGAYHWGLDETKLAHADNGTEKPADPLTDTEKAKIRAKTLEAQAKVNFEAANQAKIVQITGAAATVNVAEAQTEVKNKISQLETAKSSALQKLETNNLNDLKLIVDPFNEKTLSADDLKTEIDRIKGLKEIPTDEYKTWKRAVEGKNHEIKKAEELVGRTEKALNEKKRQINLRELELGSKKVADLKKLAFGTGRNNGDLSVIQESSWGDEAAKLWNQANPDKTPKLSLNNALASDHQAYVDYFIEKINERKYKQTVIYNEKNVMGQNTNRSLTADQVNTPLTLEQRTAYETWKRANPNTVINLEAEFKKDDIHQKLVRELEKPQLHYDNAVSNKNTLDSAKTTLLESKSSNGVSFEAYSSDSPKLAEIKRQELRHQNAVKLETQRHEALLSEEKRKLTKLNQLETDMAKAPPAIDESKLDAKQKKVLEADVRAKITAEQAARDKVKVKIAVDPMDIKDAKGFGKAWQNVDDLKAKGFTNLAEHSTNARWAGFKAGALTALIGTGLTIHQFMEAGKAQDITNTRAARLDQLRRQQLEGA